MKITRKILASKHVARLLYRFVRVYGATFRLRIEGEEQWREYLESGGAVLLGVWHQQFFPLIRHFKSYAHYNPGLMISQSRDGDIIARVAVLSGWTTVRGSSSRGGRAAMTEMIDHMRRWRFGGHLLDGPRGPAGVVKPGVIRIALDAGAAIVPVTVSSENAWHAKSWDRFMLPRPFKEVVVRFHDRIVYEPAESEEVFESYRKHLESYLLPYLVAPDPAPCREA